MGLSASSLSGGGGAQGGDFVEMLALVADPAKLQERVAALRAATEDTKTQLDLVIPVNEIAQMRANAQAELEAINAKRVELEERIPAAVAQAQLEVEAMLDGARQRLANIASTATGLISEATAIRDKARADSLASQARLTQILNEFMNARAGAIEAQALAASKAENADARAAEAAAAKAAFVAKINAIAAIVNPPAEA